MRLRLKEENLSNLWCDICGMNRNMKKKETRTRSRKIIDGSKYEF